MKLTTPTQQISRGNASPLASQIAHLTLWATSTTLLIAFAAGVLAQESRPGIRWIPIAVIFAAALSCALRAGVDREARQAWSMWALAISIWGIGAAVDAAGLGVETTTTFGDVCRVAFYPLAYLGLVQLVRGRITRFASALWLDGLIGAAAVGAVGTGVVLQPALDTADNDLPRLVLSLILPLGDMLLIAFVAGVMALNSWRPGRAWVVIGAGLGFLAIGHAWAISMPDAGSPEAQLVTLLTAMGMALVGFAAWAPTRLATQIRMEGWGLLVGPTLFGWLTVALVAYGNFAELGSLGLGLAGVTLVLVMVRTALTFRENMAIATELRDEVARASVDALTGLHNHRSFFEALDREMSHAVRHRRHLAVAMFDIDGFRQINEDFGHEVGDRVIAQVGRAIASTLRNEDLLARVGGEEFGVILPSTDLESSWHAAERARISIERLEIPGVGRITVSSGVCDRVAAADTSEMIRLAEGALYWAKTHGKNRVERYVPDVVRVLSAQERAEMAERHRTLSAITALARAVDAKDPTTQAHSEHVATVSAMIADHLGLDSHLRTAIHEAALVHDVGKIGVPDSVLRKPGGLTDEEFAIMRSHAALGAQIVADVLTEEQTSWVRHHHERIDGAGYPDGISGDDIPLGARIIAVADSWDAMTADRSYRSALNELQVIETLRSGAGSQWCPRSIAALIALFDAGALHSRGSRAPEIPIVNGTPAPAEPPAAPADALAHAGSR